MATTTSKSMYVPASGGFLCEWPSVEEYQLLDGKACKQPAKWRDQRLIGGRYHTSGPPNYLCQKHYVALAGASGDYNK